MVSSHHVHETILQRAVKEAARKASIVRRVRKLEMRIEKVMGIRLAEGGTRGATASEGSRDYERARKLDFVRCELSFNDRSGAGNDFIAKTPRGAYLYVGTS